MEPSEVLCLGILQAAGFVIVQQSTEGPTMRTGRRLDYFIVTACLAPIRSQSWQDRRVPWKPHCLVGVNLHSRPRQLLVPQQVGPCPLPEVSDVEWRWSWLEAREYACHVLDSWFYLGWPTPVREHVDSQPEAHKVWEHTRRLQVWFDI